MLCLRRGTRATSILSSSRTMEITARCADVPTVADYKAAIEYVVAAAELGEQSAAEPMVREAMRRVRLKLLAFELALTTKRPFTLSDN
jgi:carbon monoxide dehydrogenase subunit G